MSTHVTIVKKPSGHNLQVTVKNPGDAAAHEYLLLDNQAVEVMVYSDGYGLDAASGVIELREVAKASA